MVLFQLPGYLKHSFLCRPLRLAGLLLAAVIFMCLPAYAASWQDEYIVKAQSACQSNPDTNIYLINLDGDDVPEMVMNYGSVAASEELFYMDGGEVKSWMYEYYAFHYIPGSGMIRISGGRQGSYGDEIYRKSGDRFIMLASGTYTLHSSEPDRDADGAFILNDKFTYEWMGQSVDADAYKMALQTVYDLDADVTPYDRELSLSELIDTLRSGTYTEFLPGAVSGNDPDDSSTGSSLFEDSSSSLFEDSSSSLFEDSSSSLFEDSSSSLFEGTASPAVDDEPAPAGTYDLDFVSSDVTDYPYVRLYFGLNDQRGQPITLSSFDGSVTETIADGTEIERTIRSIERLDGNQGISIDIVADKSGSMQYDLGTMQTIMSDFVRSLDYSVGDEAEILSFDSYVMYMCTYTQDRNLLLNGISNMTPYGDTALYDALVTGIKNAGSRRGARCVIGFTDGEDNMSVYTPEEVIRLAQDREVPVYLIGTGSANSSLLSYIADATGGYYWDAYDIYDVSEILSLIYRGQKDMYCVEYKSDPKADPYAARTVTCSITDGYYTGNANRLPFRATPVIQTAPHTSRYELVKADVSWQEANEACILKGGHLATISSKEEMNELVQMCEKAGLKYCWLGGYTSVRNGTAFGHWITGEQFDYTCWYPGEPSRNDLDGTPEFYLMLWKVEDSWSWNDQRNDVVSDYKYFKGIIGYICEYES